MSRPDALAVVRATCDSIATHRGLELVDVSLKGGGRSRILSVTLDRHDVPITLGEIAEVSEEISRALDIDDPIPGSYTLEVSSAGIERPLFKPADYSRFVGRDIKLKLLEMIEGRKVFEGNIQSAGDQTFVLGLPKGEVVEIPYASVARANLAVDWEAELKGIDSGGKK